MGQHNFANFMLGRLFVGFRKFLGDQFPGSSIAVHVNVFCSHSDSQLSGQRPLQNCLITIPFSWQHINSQQYVVENSPIRRLLGR